MSQYPYPYGQYPPVPPPPNQYAYPNPAAYPPAPSYGSPHDPHAPPPPNYYNMSAYDYNSSIPIPGLGIGGTPVAGTLYQPPPPIPPPSAWGHHATPQYAPPAGTPDATSQFHYPPPAQFNGPADQPYPSPSYNPPPFSSKPAPTHAQATIPHLTSAATQSSEEMEEGELSEGQFDDLYDPVDSSGKSKDTTVAPNVPSLSTESQPTSAVETPTGGFYTNGEEDSSREDQPMTGKGGSASANTQARNGNETMEQATARERSGSYSPYLSPQELQPVKPSNQSHGTQDTQKTNVKVGWDAVSRTGESRVPGLGQLLDEAPHPATPSKGFVASTTHNARGSAANPNSHDSHESPSLAFKSLTEARKEAQKAILKLWPHGVRYQHYIEQGFDERVVKHLFQELHLDVSTGKPIPDSSASATQQSALSEPAASLPETSKSPSTERNIVPQPQAAAKPPATEKMAEPESRKDRIARLLAEKAAKGPAPPRAPVAAQPIVPVVAPTTLTQAPVSGLPQSQSSAPVPPYLSGVSQSIVPAVTNPSITTTPSATATPTGPPSKTKNKDEMHRLLQQKMEALKRSRELKEKGKASDQPSSSPEKASNVMAANPQPPSGLPAPVLFTNTSSPDQPVQNKAPIPGLSLFSTPFATQPVNVRKRPVAADFVDYPAQDSLKRQFGQKRQNSTLVIDVSDASDDEEMDIDMEMDSPDITAATIERPNPAARNGPSLAQFPPLRDLSRRNVSSPVSATNTPPNGAMSAKHREALAATEKALEEMRRKIAEKEARSKNKNGSQTPNKAIATPPEQRVSESSATNAPRASSAAAEQVDAPSAQLLSEAVSAQLSKPAEPPSKREFQPQPQRDRSASVKARKDAVLREKLAALRAETEAKRKAADEKRKAEEEERRAKEERRREEEARAAEEAAEQEAKLLAELQGEDESQEDSDNDNQSEQMSVDEESEEEGEAEEEHEGAQGEAMEAMAEPQTSSQEPEKETSEPAAPAPQTEDVGHTQPAAASEDVIMGQHDLTVQPAPNPTTEQGAVDQPPNLANQSAQEDTADHVAIPESEGEFSPEPAEAPLDAAGVIPAQIGELAPATISDVPRSRDDTQEIEGPVTRQPTRAVTQNPNSTFVPYESPLRYFRAFRFHPEFSKLVPGGQKSLTYSNKIDPRKELCPDELQGRSCPRGKDCEFQHLDDIRVSDEQILVQLGRSDDYTGEQKERFIQGLKELLQDFRAKNTRDFDTIAKSIIEFRATFLGDKSKILPLQGVSL